MTSAETGEQWRNMAARAEIMLDHLSNMRHGRRAVSDYIFNARTELAEMRAACLATDHKAAAAAGLLLAALRAEAEFCAAQAETPSDEGLSPEANGVFEMIYSAMADRLRAAIAAAEEAGIKSEVQ